MRARYVKRYGLVEKLFSRYPDFQFIKPEDTFYAFVKVPSYIEAARLIIEAGRYAGTSVNKDIAQEYVNAGFCFIYEHANAMFVSGAKEFQESFELKNNIG
ncbi:MAG: hypothetical protein CK528_02100 [Alcaligenaceae bacterium]|nr:MAG: hypothetical protein CK528_02100 [Alcaligenaceae bacterium]